MLSLSCFSYSNSIYKDLSSFSLIMILKYKNNTYQFKNYLSLFFKIYLSRLKVYLFRHVNLLYYDFSLI